MVVFTSNCLPPPLPLFVMNSKWDFHFEKAEKLEPSTTETAKEEEPAKSPPKKAAKSPKKKSKKKSPTKTPQQSPKKKDKSKAKQPLSPYEQIIRSPSSNGKKRKSPRSSGSAEKKRKSPRSEKEQKVRLSESEQKVAQARKSAREFDASAAKPEEEKKEDADAVVDLTFDESDSE